MKRIKYKISFWGLIILICLILLVLSIKDRQDIRNFAAPPTPISINWNTTHQQIDGFGASSAFGINTTEAQADMFFSETSGIGLSLLRTLVNYNRPNLGITRELPIMKQAIARGAKVWSTPWTPPDIWKDNLSFNGGRLLPAHYTDYANSLATYVADMKTQGVPLYALSIQNEPDFSAPYPSALWTSQEMHAFVPILYTALQTHGVSSTKILAGEEGTWSFNIVSSILNDPSTHSQVGIYAAHNYDMRPPFPLDTKGKSLWETEVSSFEAYDPSITNALLWANNIHGFMTIANANAWHWWWLYPQGSVNNGTQLDNESLTDPSWNPAKRMYVIGNYSKFIRPGYYRIDTTGATSLKVSAYKDTVSGNFAIVAINDSPTPIDQTFSFIGFGATSVTPWITSSTLNLAVQPTLPVNTMTFNYLVPAQSVVTFVGKNSSALPQPSPTPADCSSCIALSKKYFCIGAGVFKSCTDTPNQFATCSLCISASTPTNTPPPNSPSTTPIPISPIPTVAIFPTANLSPASEPTCDTCGWCPPVSKPSNWVECTACIVNPDGTEKKGSYFTVLGCFQTDQSAAPFTQSVLGIVFGIAGGIAFLTTLVGIFILMTSSGNPLKIQQGKDIILSAIVGLLLILFSVFILRAIGLDILKIPGIG